MLKEQKHRYGVRLGLVQIPVHTHSCVRQRPLESVAHGHDPDLAPEGTRAGAWGASKRAGTPRFCVRRGVEAITQRLDFDQEVCDLSDFSPRFSAICPACHGPAGCHFLPQSTRKS